MATVEIINEQIVIKFDDSEYVYQCVVPDDDEFFVKVCERDVEEFRRIFTNPAMIQRDGIYEAMIMKPYLKTYILVREGEEIASEKKVLLGDVKVKERSDIIENDESLRKDVTEMKDILKKMSEYSVDNFTALLNTFFEFQKEIYQEVKMNQEKISIYNEIIPDVLKKVKSIDENQQKIVIVLEEFSKKLNFVEESQKTVKTTVDLVQVDVKTIQPKLHSLIESQKSLNDFQKILKGLFEKNDVSLKTLCDKISTVELQLKTIEDKFVDFETKVSPKIEAKKEIKSKVEKFESLF